VVNQANPTYYPPQSATFDSEVSAAFRGNPNAVVLVAYPETGSIIVRTAYQQGLLGKQTQLLMTEGMKDPKIAELAGKDTAGKFIVSGVIGTAPSTTGPAVKQFREVYQTNYNKRQPGVFDANTWDAGALLVLAAEAAKSTAGAEIKDKIRVVANPPGQEVTDVCQALALIRQGKEINYQGASGKVDFDAQGDVVGSYDVWTIDNNGQLKVTNTITVGGF
jgi:branched-chain amino acid transport system substrate-binding protein/neutral amino acid transport system substrate-binding protein